ncbi:MAG: acyl-CoA mutase large subunit family protein [Planctomycetes bacterium]|nr:acyl-CoA mutase large subunit family protein [Planctomycetota bacterium]
MLPIDLNQADLFPPVTTADWRKLAQKDVGEGDLDKRLIARLYEGIEVKPLYTPGDFAGAAKDASGFGGFAPYTRGAQPPQSKRHGWDIRQEYTYPDASGMNTQILEDLEHGVTSLLLRFDAAGREGLDATDPAALALVGADGCSISDVEDLATALKNVHLEMVHVSLEAGGAFLPAASLLAALWQQRKLAKDQCRGAFNADPLAVLARDGHLAGGLEEALRHTGDLAAWTSRTFPKVTSVRVGTAIYHHAGATATQDLALSLATGVEYLRCLTRAGLSVDAAAGQMLHSFAIGSAFFLGAAKLRAARRLWARVVEVCGGSADAARMTMHVRPSRRIMTTRDPWVNILRNTACVLGAALGSADAIGSMPFDAPLGDPSARARRLARNTQHILQLESHLHRVGDAGGGSWYIESLTDSLANKAWEIFQQIERLGGIRACLESGWVRREIDAAAAPRARNLMTRKDGVLGVSEFARVGEQKPEIERIDRAELARNARKRLAGRHTAKLAPPPTGKGTGGIPDWAVAAAGSGATLGSLHRALTTHAPTFLAAPLALHTFAEPFEHLREASDQYFIQYGNRPRVFIASLGSPARHLPRTNFARNFCEAGGFEVIGSDEGGSGEDAVQRFRESGAAIAIIASDDATYVDALPTVAPSLHAAGARTVILAGNPGAKEAELRRIGIDRFIFVKCNVVQTLTELLREEGVNL